MAMVPGRGGALARFLSTGQRCDLRSQFLVSKKNGFLPRRDPLAVLPAEYERLEGLLREMPYTKSDGTAGLLAHGDLGRFSKEIPEYGQVERVRDTRLLSALFRDYTFWASAYLLEPCHLSMLRTGEYGLGRAQLPRNIAVPLAIISKKLGTKPFMDLYNWQKIDPSKALEYENLKLIRHFTGMPSESGFINVHVAMVAHTGSQIRETLAVLAAVEASDRERANRALRKYARVMKAINAEMETMWQRSLPNDYKEFRTFIMGIKNQPMFPNGVVYKGVSEDPVAYRGESGANDSIIPTSDNLFQLFERMPENPLTEILRDFRTYRPVEHNKWLHYVQVRAQQVKIREFCLAEGNTAVLYLENLDQIREFRQRHWNFTKEYIIKHTSHPVATGGSPIITWLPNQLSTVLSLMQETVDLIDTSKLTAARARLFAAIKIRIASQDSILLREVARLKEQIPGQK